MATPATTGHLTRRELLRAGALGTVVLATAGSALAGPALAAGAARAAGGTGGARGSRAAARRAAGAAAAPGSAGHTVSTVGALRPGGLDPSAFLTRFDTGRVSRLPSGQTLREYDLEARDRELEIAPGVFFPAWTYNGQLPGPTLRCTEGDRVRVVFRNAGSHPHTIHFHGVHPASMDGVLEVVHPGERYTYEFDAEPFGLHLYHCHVMPLKRHIHKGLYGAFIVDPPARRAPARELVMVMNAFDTNFDGQNELYAVNTVPFHYQRQPIQLLQQELVRIYLVNMTEFDLINSFHLHGNFFRLYRTGTDLERFEFTDTAMLCQGERAVLEFSYRHAGPFMFHAHQSEFAELGWMGMFDVQEAPRV